LARWNHDWPRVGSPILRCGFSVVCVATALGAALEFRSFGLTSMESPLFELAIVVTTWYAGLGASMIAVVLSALCFDYYFTEPLYSFEVTPAELPHYFLFTLWAFIVAGFLAVRRRIESELRHALNRLQVEVERSQHREKEIERLNRELSRRADELMASNKELEAFAYSVSHDLRAPLRHVAGYSELLKRQASSSLDGKSRRYVETIVESANRMGNLIDDLLAFSRIGRAETRATLISLEQLVMEVVAEIKQETTGRDIAWKIHPLPACYGDRAMLRLVIANLVSNAVKFTSARTRAEIEIGCVDTNESEVEVFVKDNGAGFDMRYAHKLFGVFQRLHLAEQFEGTGIGLAIVQRIILRHGGRVRAEGMVDHGAVFYFSLPKVQDARVVTASMP
jgi:light-regulated signal transduction histidine kinase (bacteriophytochrome)